MCGIFGLVNKNKKIVAKPILESMYLTLSKRGPDDHGVMEFDKCILGQTRLSIIDISQGHQPMRDNSGNVAITFNGEIYNYKELRSVLEGKGHTFSTNSDTEVILKSYIEYGDDAPKYLDGMFAYAIWDDDKQELHVARDRFGKKPFYYTEDNDGTFYFASEIKAILETGMVKGIVDYEAIDNYLTLMYIPPWKTVYKNIKVLPPATTAVLRDGKLETSTYWRLEKNKSEETHSPSYVEAKKEVRRLLADAVKKRMIADVEIGSFLSGGVDSTIVTLLAQSFSKTKIKTFSVGYENHINELPYAFQASKKIGSDHYPLQAKGDMVEELHKIVEYLDEPHADSSDFPQSILSKFTASKVKVALCGDGADELFLGYGWYTRHMNLSYRAHFFEKVFMDPFSGFLKAISLFSKRDRLRLWKDEGNVNGDVIPDELKNTKLSPKDKINLFDFTTYLPGQLLTKADRMGMMHSLEVRSPFLDHHLVEYVYNLPDEYKTNGHDYKILLKDLLCEYMPKDFVYRRKQGFGAPVKAWLREEGFKKDVMGLVGSKDSHISKIMNHKEINRILNEFFQEDNGDYSYKIWLLYNLELWFIHHSKYHQ